MTEDPFIKGILQDAKEIDRDTERMRAERQASQEHRRLHYPQSLGMVNDIPFTPEGRPITQNIRIINKWDDGYGNIVYTATTRTSITRGNTVYPDQFKPLSDRIAAQQTSFERLGPQEQSRLHGEFDTSNGTAESVQSYKDYLNNQALGKRFEELKANPPKPFGNK